MPPVTGKSHTILSNPTCPSLSSSLSSSLNYLAHLSSSLLSTHFCHFYLWNQNSIFPMFVFVYTGLSAQRPPYSTPPYSSPRLLSYHVLPCPVLSFPSILPYPSFTPLPLSGGTVRTNMPMYFEQDIYCLAIGHHDSALVRDGLNTVGSSHYTAPFVHMLCLYPLLLSQSSRSTFSAAQADHHVFSLTSDSSISPSYSLQSQWPRRSSDYMPHKEQQQVRADTTENTYQRSSSVRPACPGTT
jgi:hypothetical protein